MILVITVVFFSKSTYRFEHKSMSECTLRAELSYSSKEEKERLQKSCHFFEVAAVQISGLVTPVLCRQTGFLQRTLILCTAQVNRKSKLSCCQRVRALVVRV